MKLARPHTYNNSLSLHSHLIRIYHFNPDMESNKQNLKNSRRRIGIICLELMGLGGGGGGGGEGGRREGAEGKTVNISPTLKFGQDVLKCVPIHITKYVQCNVLVSCLISWHQTVAVATVVAA